MKNYANLTKEDFLNGQIILIDKPLHWSSFQAVNKLKRAILRKFQLKKIKIGHAGTLDPLASGLLLICTGKFTKKIPEIQNASKVYTGEITIGATTPSFDMETAVNQLFPYEHISPEIIEKEKQNFIGDILQFPPVFSALKKDGKRLYELARQGQEVEISPRKITIYSLNVNSENFPKLTFEVHCSKGTYIRSLANDFGKALQSGGYLSELRRTKIGEFSVEDALSPDTFVTLLEEEK